MNDATAARPCGTWEELCLFLDGSPSSFTGMLLTLIEKADPGNRYRLRQEFPRQVAAWEAWREIAPCTWGELEVAADARMREQPRGADPASGARWDALKGDLVTRINSDYAVAQSLPGTDTAAAHFALVSANRSTLAKMRELEGP